MSFCIASLLTGGRKSTTSRTMIRDCLGAVGKLIFSSKPHTMSRVCRKIQTANYELWVRKICSFFTFWFVKVINIKISNIWKIGLYFQIIQEKMTGKSGIFQNLWRINFSTHTFWNICDGKNFSVTDISKSMREKIDSS